eukprot:5439524-Alexandrium_andersonii.AAC.1
MLHPNEKKKEEEEEPTPEASTATSSAGGAIDPPMLKIMEDCGPDGGGCWVASPAASRQSPGRADMHVRPRVLCQSPVSVQRAPPINRLGHRQTVRAPLRHGRSRKE